MTNTHQRYLGFKPFKMDSKYRVSIPTNWRPDAGAPLYLIYAKERDMPLVRVLSQEAYDEKVQTIHQSDKTPAEKGKLLGKLAMLCREATLNEQGKLLVPKDLSELAGIAAESDVTLAGRGIHFEIWNKENFDIKLALDMAEEDDGELGIF